MKTIVLELPEGDKRQAKVVFRQERGDETLLAIKVTGQQPLAVWFDSMPESNGKRNWTVVLHPADATGFDLFEKGFQVHRSEYYDRARYDADSLKFMLGLIEKEPFILDYDENLKAPAEY